MKAAGEPEFCVSPDGRTWRLTTVFRSISSCLAARWEGQAGIDGVQFLSHLKKIKAALLRDKEGKLSCHSLISPQSNETT